jgi:hypothetical protein
MKQQAIKTSEIQSESPLALSRDTSIQKRSYSIATDYESALMVALASLLINEERTAWTEIAAIIGDTTTGRQASQHRVIEYRYEDRSSSSTRKRGRKFAKEPAKKQGNKSMIKKTDNAEIQQHESKPSIFGWCLCNSRK